MNHSVLYASTAGGAAAMAVVLLIVVGSLGVLVHGTYRSIRDERNRRRSVWREFSLSLVFMILFFASWIGQAIAQYQEFTDEAISHGQHPGLADFLSSFSASTLENWQSEFLQLFSFVTLSALYIHKGSAESKDGDDNVQASLRRIETAMGTLPMSAPQAPGEQTSFRRRRSRCRTRRASARDQARANRHRMVCPPGSTVTSSTRPRTIASPRPVGSSAAAIVHRSGSPGGREDPPTPTSHHPGGSSTVTVTAVPPSCWTTFEASSLSTSTRSRTTVGPAPSASSASAAHPRTRLTASGVASNVRCRRRGTEGSATCTVWRTFAVRAGPSRGWRAGCFAPDMHGAPPVHVHQRRRRPPVFTGAAAGRMNATDGLCHRSLRHIAVIRARPGLGDMLCAVPALRSLRRGSPSARITLVGLSNAAWFVDRFRWYVDDLLVLPAWPTVPAADGTAAATLEMLASALPPFDLAVQLHGSGGPINRLGPALGATLTIAHERMPLRTSRLLTRRWPDTGHESERLHDLVTWAGFPAAGTHLEFPEIDGDGDRVEELLRDCVVPIVVLHPGASRVDHRWDSGGFATVADRLHDAGVLPVIATGSSERHLADEVMSRCRCRPMVAPPLEIAELAALLRRATALVANDSGVAHLGVAVGTPSVVIGTSSDLDRWGPRDRVRHRAVVTVGHRPTDERSVWHAVASVLPRR